MTNDNTSAQSSVKSHVLQTGTTLQKSSIISVLCRICYDGDKDEELITPCNCKGTVAFVHKSCLETWLGESNTTACELCHTTFKTERTPRYTSRQSIWQWIRSNPSGLAQGVRSDIVACAVITPLAIVITYVCLFSSEYYNQKKFANVPAARWTSVSLLVMIGIMLIGYYMWVYSVIRMHARMWYNWWQRTCDVRYIAPTTVVTRPVVINEENALVNQNILIPLTDSNTSGGTYQTAVVDVESGPPASKGATPKLPRTVESNSDQTAVIEMEDERNTTQTEPFQELASRTASISAHSKPPTVPMQANDTESNLNQTVISEADSKQVIEKGSEMLNESMRSVSHFVPMEAPSQSTVISLSLPRSRTVIGDTSSQDDGHPE